jgi:hypothetical protein
MDIWRRPEEFGPGFTRAYAILIPGSELRTWPKPEQKAGSVHFLPPPNDGELVQIEVLLIRPTEPPATLMVDQCLQIAHFALHDGTAVGVLARILPWTDESALNLQTAKKGAISAASAAPEGRARLQSAAHPRIAFYGQEPDGTRVVTDAAVDV